MAPAMWTAPAVNQVSPECAWSTNMPECASHYPISQFIARIMNDRCQDRMDFVRSLGYRNLERGLRRLGPWLDEGEGYGRIIGQIAAAYPKEAEELRKAIGATREVKRAEFEAAFLEDCKAEQDTFQPFIHVDGETTRPSSITMFGVTGGRWNLIRIPPAILDLPLAGQLSAVPDLMREYLQEYKGQCPFFGKVTGFRFVRCLDYFRFDPDGRFLERVDKPFRRAPCVVSLK
jgi:hypothetical protein